jgi:hypothetical protein
VRLGVYVDAFNLYYGARSRCGRGTPGWRWLDVRGLAEALVPASWPDARIERVVYCTARISGADNPSGAADQAVYLNALIGSGSVDVIEEGYYQSKVRFAPLATRGRRGRPVLARPEWPLKLQAPTGGPMEDTTFIVSVAHREEKGSDVNVASHLLIDVLACHVDAAIVISNDSDLRLPIQAARARVPVGTVNPGAGYTAGALNGSPDGGVGGHWWTSLTDGDYRAHQLPPVVGTAIRPNGW